MVRGVNVSCDQSPCIVAAVSSIAPLNTIWRAVERNGLSPSSCRFANDVPITHPMHASWIAITPITNDLPHAPPSVISGHTSTTMPLKTRASPASDFHEKQSTLGLNSSTIVDQNG